MTAPPAIGADRLPPVPDSPNGVMRCRRKRTSHLLDRHAELVRRDLGQGRLVALTVRHLLGEHRDGAVGLEHRARRFAGDEPAPTTGHDRLLEVGWSGRGLDERGEPEPEHSSLGARLGLAFRPVLEVGELERALERRAGRHAHVERRSGQHPAGQLVGPDDVAQPDLVAADARARAAAMSSTRSRTHVSTAHGPRYAT